MAYAAGILILSWHNGKLFSLLGKDQYYTYSDFGGKCEYNDKGNTFVTAARETYEEMCGSYLSITELIYKLYDAPVIETLSYTNKPYYMYIVFIPYDENICNHFDKIATFIHPLSNMYKFKEKISIKWILFSDVLHNNVSLRNIFHRTIEFHKDKILCNAYKYKRTNTKYYYGEQR